MKTVPTTIRSSFSQMHRVALLMTCLLLSGYLSWAQCDPITPGTSTSLINWNANGSFGVTVTGGNTLSITYNGNSSDKTYRGISSADYLRAGDDGYIEFQVDNALFPSCVIGLSPLNFNTNLNNNGTYMPRYAVITANTSTGDYYFYHINNGHATLTTGGIFPDTYCTGVDYKTGNENNGYNIGQHGLSNVNDIFCFAYPTPKISYKYTWVKIRRNTSTHAIEFYYANTNNTTTTCSGLQYSSTPDYYMMSDNSLDLVAFVYGYPNKYGNLTSGGSTAPSAITIKSSGFTSITNSVRLLPTDYQISPDWAATAPGNAGILLAPVSGDPSPAYLYSYSSQLSNATGVSANPITPLNEAVLPQTPYTLTVSDNNNPGWTSYSALTNKEVGNQVDWTGKATAGMVLNGTTARRSSYSYTAHNWTEGATSNNYLEGSNQEAGWAEFTAVDCNASSNALAYDGTSTAQGGNFVFGFSTANMQSGNNGTVSTNNYNNILYGFRRENEKMYVHEGSATGIEIGTLAPYTYPGSTVDANGGCGIGDVYRVERLRDASCNCVVKYYRNGYNFKTTTVSGGSPICGQKTYLSVLVGVGYVDAYLQGRPQIQKIQTSFSHVTCSNCNTSSYRIKPNENNNNSNTVGSAQEELIDNTRIATTVTKKVKDWDYQLHPNLLSNGDYLAHIKLDNDETGQVDIYAADGKLISSHYVYSGDNELNLKQLTGQSGVYIYHVIVNGEDRYTGKLVQTK